MLLRDRRPSAQLSDFIDRLRRTVAKSGVSSPNTGADARNVGNCGDSSDYRPYDVLTTGEAAAILGITANGVRDLARRGRIPAHRAGGSWLYPATSIVTLAERRAAKRG
ncbi:helix-turn-helix domain-containing protein [Mycobacterium sp. DL592]|uniref:helix-turn-helix domain-containing protein n=1 Tax=Mycobacterium sp. DL592 TaxID=2675524 RepID=UPI00352FBC69